MCEIQHNDQCRRWIVLIRSIKSQKVSFQEIWLRSIRSVGFMKDIKNRTEKFVEDLKKIYQKHGFGLKAIPKIVDGKIEADIHIIEIKNEKSEGEN